MPIPEDEEAREKFLQERVNQTRERCHRSWTATPFLLISAILLSPLIPTFAVDLTGAGAVAGWLGVAAEGTFVLLCILLNRRWLQIGQDVRHAQDCLDHHQRRLAERYGPR
jgi:hypothetical protein